MISAKDLFLRTRLYAGDLQKTRYSDFELVEAVNAAIDVFCGALRKYFSPELVRRAELVLSDGAAPLPTGFLSVVTVRGQNSSYEGSPGWHIEGETFFSDDSPAALFYMKHPGKAATDEDEIDLSESFLSGLAKMAAQFLAGDTSAAEERADAMARESSCDKRGNLPDEGMWLA